MGKNEARLGRVNEELMKEISHVITFELKNPEVTGLVSITKVKVTPDFRYAQVYVSFLGTKSKGKNLEGLKKSAKFIRSQVARTINLRYTPEIVFVYDDSMEQGEKIDNILKEIKEQDEKFKKSKEEENNENNQD